MTIRCGPCLWELALSPGGRMWVRHDSWTPGHPCLPSAASECQTGPAGGETELGLEEEWRMTRVWPVGKPQDPGTGSSSPRVTPGFF